MRRSHRCFDKQVGFVPRYVHSVIPVKQCLEHFIPGKSPSVEDLDLEASQRVLDNAGFADEKFEDIADVHMGIGNRRDLFWLHDDSFQIQLQAAVALREPSR